jgi:hypothetical protein
MGGEVHFGLAGLTGADTARLNALCVNTPTREGGSEPCEVAFIFHTAEGRVLKQSSMTLMPGTGGFLDFRTAEVGLPVRRGEIVPCVRVARGAALSTLEVFDTFSGLGNVLAHGAAALAP